MADAKLVASARLSLGRMIRPGPLGESMKPGFSSGGRGVLIHDLGRVLLGWAPDLRRRPETARKSGVRGAGSGLQIGPEKWCPRPSHAAFHGIRFCPGLIPGVHWDGAAQAPGLRDPSSFPPLFVD